MVFPLGAVTPFSVTAPVPVVKVLDPEIVVSPASVSVPVRLRYRTAQSGLPTAATTEKATFAVVGTAHMALVRAGSFSAIPRSAKNWT